MFKDMVNHPPHYVHRWGEVIDITENMSFCMGNAVKYLLRAEHKGSFEQDLRKAIWYIERELLRRGSDDGSVLRSAKQADHHRGE